MGFFDFLSGATPGGAVGTVAKDLTEGIFSGITKVIEEFHMSPEDEARVKLALLQHQVQVTQQILNDVQHARSMQMTTRSIWPGVMSALAVGGFFGGFFCLLFYGIPSTSDEMTKTVINMFAGAMIAAFADARSFWLGSSAGSQNKDILLHNSTPVQK